MELVKGLIQMLNPHEFGYFSWNPHEERSVEKVEYPLQQLFTVTVNDVMNSLEIGRVPPILQDISDVNKSLVDGPVELGKGPRQFIDYSICPYVYPDAIPLFVAQQKGCKTEQIDFLFSGSTLGVLYHRQFHF